MKLELTKIPHTFSVTNSAGVSVQISVVYDITNAPEAVVKAWIAADRTIAYQRVLKPLSEKDIKALDGKTVIYDGSRSKGIQESGTERMVREARAAGVDPTDEKAMTAYIMAELKKRS